MTIHSAILTVGSRTNYVKINRREYETERLTESSQRRLLALLNNVPENDRCVELERDFTPTTYFFFRKLTFKMYVTPALPGGDAGCFPAAYSIPELDSEYADWLDSLCPDVPRDEPSAREYTRLMTTTVSFWSETDHALYTQKTGRTMHRLTLAAPVCEASTVTEVEFLYAAKHGGI